MSLYDILNVQPTASRREIKKAYQVKALEYHPDRHQSNKAYYEEKFKEVGRAYEILYNEASRQAYDKHQTVESEGTDPMEIFRTVFQGLDSDWYQLFNSAYKVYKNFDKKHLMTNAKQLLTQYLSRVGHHSDEPEPSATSPKTGSQSSLEQTIPMQPSSVEPTACTSRDTHSPIYAHYSSKEIQELVQSQTPIIIPISLRTCLSRSKVSIALGDVLFPLSVENHTHHLRYNSSCTVEVKLKDLTCPDFKRVNSFDLLSTIDIGMEDYYEGFELQTPHILGLTSPLRFHLSQCSSLIVKIPQFGLPIWSEQTRGDYYIEFRLKPDVGRVQSPLVNHNHDIPHSKNTYVVSLSNVLNSLNVYD